MTELHALENGHQESENPLARKVVLLSNAKLEEQKLKQAGEAGAYDGKRISHM